MIPINPYKFSEKSPKNPKNLPPNFARRRGQFAYFSMTGGVLADPPPLAMPDYIVPRYAKITPF